MQAGVFNLFLRLAQIPITTDISISLNAEISLFTDNINAKDKKFDILFTFSNKL